MVVSHSEFPSGSTSEFSPAVTVIDPFMVNNTNDSGQGSLRQAILNANASLNSGGPDQITFAIPGAGPHIIQPLTDFPQITEAVVIDGLSQTNATCGTNGFSDRALKVVLDGSLITYVALGPNTSAFDISQNTNDVTIQGLVINSFPGGGIQIGMGNSGSVIRCNYIGTDETGLVARGNFGSGVQIDGFFAVSTGNVIGGASATDGNLISANGHDEIHLEPGGDNNTIANNLIGTDATGVAILPAPNGYFGDPNIDNFSNLIGLGSNQGAGNTISGNVFGGFGNAVELVSRFSLGEGQRGGANVFQGNFVGTDRTGAINLGNGVGVSVAGDDAAIGSEYIGGPNPAHANLIMNNGGMGVLVQGAPDHVVEGNVIEANDTGVSLNGTAVDVSVLGNVISFNNTGVLVDASDRAVVRDNTISGNQGDGILLRNGADDASILLNRVGVGVDGVTNEGNAAAGIWVETSQNTLIQDNVVSGNGDSGIVLTGGASDNIVLDNIAGLDVSGSILVP
ncbi:MAG: right-handed parallel beta-helix repeat-containing protein, partial [Pontimonas sp.]